jgi:hypothetical protein
VSPFAQWQGLVNNQAGGYLWSNNLRYTGMGFPGHTTNVFVNTGIHSPKKYDAEPFRWAGDNPVKNHDIGFQEMTASPPTLSPITTYTQTTKTRTYKLIWIVEQLFQNLTL